jgi:thioredoxin reductase (NADPH)
VILCVASDPVALGEVEDQLGKRYLADYEVRAVSTGEAAITAVRKLVGRGRHLALVIAGDATSDPGGADVLAETRALSPGTRRALLVRAGERPVQPSVLHAASLGVIHFWLVKPGAAELAEEFHHTVEEALYSWSLANRPYEWVRVVGAPWSPRTHEIRDLLTRNRVPFGFYDAESDAGLQVLAEVGAPADRLPVLAIGDGTVLVQPSTQALATALGGETRPRSPRYDVVVIGAGPAGLAAAVAAASEGLHTLVLEREAIGGQAGTSSLIRNYLGFPLGIGGGELALRAFHQGLLFGVEFVFANGAASLGGGTSTSSPCPTAATSGAGPS